MNLGDRHKLGRRYRNIFLKKRNLSKKKLYIILEDLKIPGKGRVNN